MELLNIIKPLNGLVFEVKDTIAPTNYTYNVSICSHIEGSGPNVAAVQYENTKDKKKIFTLGKSNMVDIMGGTDWILLTYYGGDKYGSHCNYTERVTRIMIICDPNVLKGKFEILEERRLSKNMSNCYYLFELGSNVSCTVKKEEILPQKLSSGSVFCILFFYCSFSVSDMWIFV
ncbi:cation-dependent mannose-6-phosphate receptor [Trichonephila inaurata madagascariensis]|uniref:Cation-dependent mannose-6-phosphate receptor n=1 Tax=Trichonephila inaurata madagascariensis TaxID=2747483 RepID=A0A8X7BT75_9ARAC|nr:cation-dependent mannose-6-phosphate receptor [Trichonephila inaurata madagascariensis]